MFLRQLSLRTRKNKKDIIAEKALSCKLGGIIKRYGDFFSFCFLTFLYYSRLKGLIVIKSRINSISPKISVVMSCYNAAAFIAEAMASILRQTFADFELILIDDGSTDKTLNIIRQYALKDSRIVVIHKKNTGPADSRNAGILVARGEWIAILDSDDIALPTRLEDQISFFKISPDILLLGTGAIELDEHGKAIKTHCYPCQHHALCNSLMRSRRFFPHSSVMYRSDVVKRLGGYNTHFYRAQDMDMFLRLTEEGNIACLNKPLVKIRKHYYNISLDAGGRTTELYGIAALVCHFLRIKGAADPSTSNNDADWLAFTEWIAGRLEQEGVFEICHDWARMRQAYYSASNKFIGARRLMTGLVLSKHTFRILHEKLYGSSLALTLSDEWMKKHGALSSGPHLL